MNEFKRQRWKRRLVHFCLVFAGAFLLLNVLAYCHAYTMMHFEAGKRRTGVPESLSIGQKIGVLLCGMNLPRPRTDVVVSVLGPAALSFQIDGDDHVKLGAWHCPSAPRSPLVILFHGYAGEKSGTVAEAKAFLDMGCSVLLIDFRGSGDSSEAYTTVGYVEAKDVAAAMRYAQKQFSSSKIILYGQSMGAAAVLRAAHCCGAKPDAIIVEAVFDKLLNTVRHRFEAMKTPSFPCAELLVFWGGVQAGFNGFSHNPMDYARSVSCPILFLHGAADPRAHLDEARRVFDAVPGPKVFREFPNIGHAPTISRFPAEWKQTVGDFLRTNHLISA